MKEMLAQFKGKIPFLLGLFGMVIYSSSINLLTPVLASISEAFPEQGMTSVQMIMSIPSILSIPIQFLTGFLVAYIYKKRLVQFSLAMVTLGGVLPLLIHDNFAILLVSSACIGLGGFSLTLSSALVAENFDGRARGFMFGFNGAVQGVAMMLLVLLAGYLGTIGYWASYWVFVPAAICLVIVSIFFPLGEKEQRMVGKGVGFAGVKAVFTPGLIFLCLITLLTACAQFTFLNNTSYLVVEKGLGDAMSAGVATSFVTVMRIVIGALLGFILMAFKRFTLPVAFLISAASFFVSVMATDMTMFIVANVLFGIAMSMQVFSGYEYVTVVVDKKTITMAMAIFMCCTSIGVSLSPIVTNALSGGTGAVGNFVVAGIMFLVAFVIMMIREIFFDKESPIGKAGKAPAGPGMEE